MENDGSSKPPSFGIVQFVFVTVLAVILLLLGHSMVRHRFFQGGREHRNGSIGQ
jgi:hypothetical protein